MAMCQNAENNKLYVILGPQYVTHDYFMPLIYCEWHLPLMEDPEAHHLQIRVGGFNPTPLKNMTSSVGMMKFPI